MPDMYSPVAAILEPGHHGAVLPAGPGVSISERPLGGLVQLAGWADFETAANPVVSALGFQDLGHYRKAQAAGSRNLYRIAPDKLWIAGAAMGDLPTVMGGGSLAVLDLSHSRTRICVDGLAAEDVLVRLAAIDFRKRSFAVGDFVQTGIQHIGMLIHRVSDTRFDLLTPVTWARSIWESIELNAKPFGYIIEARNNGAQ
jgi:heterotetrameric sarcosine oxidase gamma subunit